MSKEIANVHLNIGDGGVTFKIVDEGYGPTVEICSSHFGNNSTVQQIRVTHQDLNVLARLFKFAFEKTRYSEEYCYSAKTYSVSPLHAFKGVWGEPSYGDDGNEECEGFDTQDVVQGGYSADNFHAFYAHQYVADEVHESDGDCIETTVKLVHTPYISGTLVGSIICDGSEHKFTSSVDNELVFRDEVSDLTLPIPVAGRLNANGNLFILWSDAPGPLTVKVSYEYDTDV
jgi:hypothetical protein